MATELGRKIIQDWEGTVLKVYRDKYGYLTAGRGHLLTFDERTQFPYGSCITQDQCDKWLDSDLAKVDRAIDALGLDLNEHRRAALESLLFNAGVGMLAGRAPKLTAALCAGQWSAAAHEFLDICHAVDQTGIRHRDAGLANRRKAESAIFLQPMPVIDAPSLDVDAVLALVGLTTDQIRREMFRA